MLIYSKERVLHLIKFYYNYRRRRFISAVEPKLVISGGPEYSEAAVQMIAAVSGRIRHALALLRGLRARLVLVRTESDFFRMDRAGLSSDRAGLSADLAVLSADRAGALCGPSRI